MTIRLRIWRHGHCRVIGMHKLARVVGAALFVLALWLLARELGHIGFTSLRASLRSVPHAALAAALIVTALDYLVLTFHDQLAVSYAGVRIGRARVTLASFIGYAVSNNVGFALLSGASARYRFYARWGVSSEDLSRIVAFYSTTFWIGLCLIGGASLVFSPPGALTSVVSREVSVAAGSIGIALVAVYTVMCLGRFGPVRIGRLNFPLPYGRTLVLQFLLSTLDWLLAAAVLFVLIPTPRPSLLLVTGAFAAAQLAALFSHVPGGIGVFEGLMVLLLGSDVSAVTLVPALLLFRIIYYFVPLSVALALLLVDEAHERRTQLTRWRRASHAVTAWAVPRVLAILTFASGVILLFSGATPGLPGRLAWLDRIMPLPLMELSHFAASLTGLGLLLLAQAIARRVDAAFYVTAAALAIGGAASLLKGADYEEAVVLALVLAGLVSARHHFTRRARILEYRLSAGWLVAMLTAVAASVWLGLFAYRHVSYRSDLWWQFAVHSNAPRFLRASVGVMIAALVIAVRQLLAPALPRRQRIDPAMAPDLDRVIAHQPRTAPYLVYLGDKSVLWNEARTAFLMYAVRGRSCVALGDPVGPRYASEDLVQRFMTMCERSGSIPVFYESTDAMLPAFADAGLAVLKCGEEARVALPTFSIMGSTFKALRSSLNRMAREGCVFRVMDTAEVNRRLSELEEISDEWLARKGMAEKGFSLGYFQEDYVRHFPAAVLEQDGHVAAFATLWEGPGCVELSVDLMRYSDAAPPGAMDALFTQMMLWGREQGYQWFNLGMAPLSGLSGPTAAHAWTRLAGFVYRNGEPFYNFQGVHAYKAKFGPVWQPRYLAYPGGLSLARVVTDITMLIGGGYRRMIFRPAKGAAA